jgi:calcineurin-like phosphoesterase family protein
MTLFFTPDTHLGDHRTINIWRRPFAKMGEMDRLTVERWNATVGLQDQARHLGDVAHRADDVPSLLSRLNGIKHLGRRNNDPEGAVAASGQASVHDYAELKVDGRKLVLCNYLFRSWNGQAAAQSTCMAIATGL